MATPRSFPWVWCTWIVGLLSGDSSCRWSTWFQATHKFDKVQQSNAAQLAAWKGEHADMVTARAAALRADGWTVFLEKQNKFVLSGQVAVLSGQPDIVAVREQDALVVDCKTGSPRDKDFWQVCVYMMALPLKHPACRDRRLVGEVQYRSHALTIQPDDFTLAMRERIGELMREIAGPVPPARVPSYDECRFCSIGAADCPERVETPPVEEEVEHALF